jgi:hypothetical protein
MGLSEYRFLCGQRVDLGTRPGPIPRLKVVQKW